MTSKDPRDVIISPVVSEKSYAAYDANVYTFIVAPDANKIEIRKAVEELFGKKVEKVAHDQPQGQAQAQPPHRHVVDRADAKRAIVTLAAGETRIDIFGS